MHRQHAQWTGNHALTLLFGGPSLYLASQAGRASSYLLGQRREHPQGKGGGSMPCSSPLGIYVGATVPRWIPNPGTRALQ